MKQKTKHDGELKVCKLLGEGIATGESGYPLAYIFSIFTEELLEKYGIKIEWSEAAEVVYPFVSQLGQFHYLTLPDGTTYNRAFVPVQRQSRSKILGKR